MKKWLVMFFVCLSVFMLMSAGFALEEENDILTRREKWIGRVTAENTPSEGILNVFQRLNARNTERKFKRSIKRWIKKAKKDLAKKLGVRKSSIKLVKNEGNGKNYSTWETNGGGGYFSDYDLSMSNTAKTEAIHGIQIAFTVEGEEDFFVYRKQGIKTIGPPSYLSYDKGLGQMQQVPYINYRKPYSPGIRTQREETYKAVSAQDYISHVLDAPIDDITLLDTKYFTTEAHESLIHYVFLYNEIKYVVEEHGTTLNSPTMVFSYNIIDKIRPGGDNAVFQRMELEYAPPIPPVAPTANYTYSSQLAGYSGATPIEGKN